jgi:hypothetical protein
MSIKTTNYKRWSFRFLVYIILLQLTIFYKIYTFEPGIHDPSGHSFKISIASGLVIVLLFPGIIFTILTIVNKERKNYKYFFSIIGFPILLIYIVTIFMYALREASFFTDF